ncbi:uncharacterized protein EV422DRAFT_106408 [Fimicolochytrium jonesii]|uniref:uncharacterized protein n=1 Tax=Fimicolochytrium jonesii TaxID=1396493 RepID=UPI0022FDB62E|nr:uncharacterized protein EV422DRAFT_106408 [Fimicolochytrium jonesii]KAI8819763.1 hypothetical protein EV422DRAFT_106408 [Fimicolochytrium jonesii]
MRCPQTTTAFALLLATAGLISTAIGAAVDPAASLLTCLQSIPGTPELVVPSSTPGAYANEKNGINIHRQRFPNVILYATGEEHVQGAVNCAVLNHAVPVARSGGHSYEAMSSFDGKTSVIVDVSSLTTVRIDEQEHTAVVGAGIRLGNLYASLGRQSDPSWTFPGGTCPTVGLGGHSAVGGYGMLARKYGIAADHVLEFRVVNANGTVLIANKSQNPDLFWGLRGGGGGNLGIVTQLKLSLVSAPQNAIGGIGYRLDQLPQVVDLFQKWIPTMPAELTVQLTLWADNPYPGGFGFNVHYLGTTDRLQQLLGEAGFFSIPTLGSGFQQVSVVQARAATAGVASDTPDAAINALQNPTRLQAAWRTNRKLTAEYYHQNLDMTTLTRLTQVLREIPAEATGVLVQFEAFGPQSALWAVPTDATPYPHRAGTLFSIQYGVQYPVDNTQTYPSVDAFYAKLKATLVPLASGLHYAGYIDSDFSPASHYGGNWPRLVQVKRAYDPLNVFYNEMSPKP